MAIQLKTIIIKGKNEKEANSLRREWRKENETEERSEKYAREQGR